MIARGPSVDLVFVGLGDWDRMLQRPQHIARELAKYCRVHYVRGLPLSRLLVVISSGRVVETVHNIRRVRPLLLSPGRLSPAVAANERLVRRAVVRSLGDASPEAANVVLYVQHPSDVHLVGRIGAQVVCYDCIDDHPAFKSGKSRELVVKQERELLAKSDLVLCSSSALLQRARQFNSAVFLVPNGVEYERFGGTSHCPIPADMAGIAKPIVGYYGTLGDWVDLTLVEQLARLRPWWSFVLIGPAVPGRRQLPRGANIHWLGEKPYESLPAYLNAFRVCLLAKRQGGPAAAMDSVKVYEYLAAGKPVVATDMPETRRLGELLYLASSVDEFIAQIEKALQESDLAAVERRRAFARTNSWARRGDQVWALIQRALSIREQTSCAIAAIATQGKGSVEGSRQSNGSEIAPSGRQGLR